MLGAEVDVVGGREVEVEFRVGGGRLDGVGGGGGGRWGVRWMLRAGV